MNKTEILLWGANGYNETRKSSSTAGSGKAGFRNKSKKKRRTRLDRNDDGTGTLERYKKDSFYWYQNVIKTNGACLNEQVKKITRHFVLRKEKIVHEKS